MSLKRKVWLWLGLLVSAILGVDLSISYTRLNSELRAETEYDARTIYGFMMATRRVYHKQFIASGLPVNESTLGFLPAHSASRISKEFSNWSDSGVLFNNVSDRPRNPGNRADPEEMAEGIRGVLAEMAAEPDATFQQAGALFQDFTIRCRMQGIKAHGLDATVFRKRFSAALAGFDGTDQDETTDLIMGLAQSVPEDLLAPFLAMARAASLGEPCPDDDALARLYGTSSTGRVRRMIEYLERSGLIVVRTDFSGRRTVAIPQLNLVTAPD